MRSPFFDKNVRKTDFVHVVEAGGVEPPSENVLTGTSPGADGLLEFPSQSASRHAQRVGSFMMHGALKALRTHGPH